MSIVSMKVLFGVDLDLSDNVKRKEIVLVSILLLSYRSI